MAHGLIKSEFDFDETVRRRLDMLEVVPACLKILERRRKEARGEAAAREPPRDPVADFFATGPPFVGPPNLEPYVKPKKGKIKQEDLPFNRPEQRRRVPFWNYETKRTEMVTPEWARGRSEYDHGVHAGERIGGGPVAGEGDAEARG